jgi:hypothetical protein
MQVLPSEFSLCMQQIQELPLNPRGFDLVISLILRFLQLIQNDFSLIAVIREK